VDAPLSAFFVLLLEVLHDIGHIDLAAVEPRLDEGLVQQPPGGSDEGPAGQVLFMPRLLADQHDGGSGISLAEDEGEGFISYFWKFRPA
jgi:hypothetical protein